MRRQFGLTQPRSVAETITVAKSLVTAGECTVKEALVRPDACCPQNAPAQLQAVDSKARDSALCCCT
jgi:hypothetical protein